MENEITFEFKGFAVMATRKDMEMGGGLDSGAVLMGASGKPLYSLARRSNVHDFLIVEDDVNDWAV